MLFFNPRSLSKHQVPSMSIAVTLGQNRYVRAPVSLPFCLACVHMCTLHGHCASTVGELEMSKSLP